MSRDLQSFDVPTSDGMPALGLGTWENDDPEQCTESVKTALEMGYRHVDTAQIYGNERPSERDFRPPTSTGRRIPRDESVDRQPRARDVAASTRESSPSSTPSTSTCCTSTGRPAGAYGPEETLPAFAELRDDGLIDRIGVSNFEPEHLDAATDALGEAPFANQVECHPLLRQEELREYADANGVELVGTRRSLAGRSSTSRPSARSPRSTASAPRR